METKLFDAIENNNFTEVKTLIEEGADVNVKTKDDYGLTPLHYASSYGNAKIVKLLIEHGADVNARGEYGCTPLHVAYWHGHFKIAELLENAMKVNHCHFETVKLQEEMETKLFDAIKNNNLDQRTF